MQHFVCMYICPPAVPCTLPDPWAPPAVHPVQQSLTTKRK